MDCLLPDVAYRLRVGAVISALSKDVETMAPRFANPYVKAELHCAAKPSRTVGTNGSAAYVQMALYQVTPLEVPGHTGALYAQSIV